MITATGVKEKKRWKSRTRSGKISVRNAFCKRKQTSASKGTDHRSNVIMTKVKAFTKWICFSCKKKWKTKTEMWISRCEKVTILFFGAPTIFCNQPVPMVCLPEQRHQQPWLMSSLSVSLSTQTILKTIWQNVDCQPGYLGSCCSASIC